MAKYAVTVTEKLAWEFEVEAENEEELEKLVGGVTGGEDLTPLKEAEVVGSDVQWKEVTDA